MSQDIAENKSEAPWTWVVLLYFFLLLSFALIAFYRVSSGRDPFIGTWRIPGSETFRLFCGLFSAFSGITSLTLAGYVLDRGSTNQMLALLPLLPLILILLDGISLIEG